MAIVGHAETNLERIVHNNYYYYDTSNTLHKYLI